MLTRDNLEKRKEALMVAVKQLEDNLKDHQERMKIMKKEIANGRGAIIELDHLMEQGV